MSIEKNEEEINQRFMNEIKDFAGYLNIDELNNIDFNNSTQLVECVDSLMDIYNELSSFDNEETAEKIISEIHMDIKQKENVLSNKVIDKEINTLLNEIKSTYPTLLHKTDEEILDFIKQLSDPLTEEN
eukprot:TRINITY_DN1986_c0_g1_i1.p1 TRINITY_DN1986_c0_g1~~TRINITY_DN1986_c0_g1_i1.p1  ORF type:complete len:129 (+),score=43.85 TRINITY_DN1986_c0_g1_i1:220-606(+)